MEEIAVPSTRCYVCNRKAELTASPTGNLLCPECLEHSRRWAGPLWDFIRKEELASNATREAQRQEETITEGRIHRPERINYHE